MSKESAFPHSHVVHSRGVPSHEDSHYEDGMTLRDYFAAKAMQSLIINPTVRKDEPPKDFRLQIAAWAFDYADAMLEARNGDGKRKHLGEP